ncbi:MAG: acyloxyacyl hydrolase [Nitrospirae bacterium]|nr:acyloxyacyl hydrolase [Nitrospirota bacterium]
MTAATSRKPSLAWFALTQLHASYYLVDDLALVYGGQFGYVEAPRTAGGVYGGPELGIRLHFAQGKRSSLYVEALAGAVYQQHSITPASLRFNFDLQGGGGATYRISHNTLLGGGVRAHHLSNARVRGRNHNMGYDGTMLYLELMRAF